MAKISGFTWKYHQLGQNSPIEYGTNDSKKWVHQNQVHPDDKCKANPDAHYCGLLEA
jgi:hypothetical protein